MLTLNGIECGGLPVFLQKDELEFSLSNTTIEDVAAIETPYILKDGEETVASYDGYVKTGIYKGIDDDSVRLRCARELDASSKEAINALETNMGVLSTKVDEAVENSNDTQLKTVAHLVTPSISFASVTATDVVAIPDYIPEWKDVKHFEQNDPCKYNDTIYRASQAHDRQDIYPPDVAGESMYYPIEVAEDGIIVYRTCHGAYDQVHAGEKRHYPTASDPVYQAKVDTAYDPSTRPDDWKLVE